MVAKKDERPEMKAKSKVKTKVKSSL